jgi:hypothetical protein
MLWGGVAMLVWGVFLSAFKGWVVWDIAHDPYNGGGAPTADFAIFCPMPLAFGASLVLRALDMHPFPGFGFAAYFGLAGCFGFLLWYFYRLGEPQRQRQWEASRRRPSEGPT